jgi:hypothetical protein
MMFNRRGRLSVVEVEREVRRVGGHRLLGEGSIEGPLYEPPTERPHHGHLLGSSGFNEL